LSRQQWENLQPLLDNSPRVVSDAIGSSAEALLGNADSLPLPVEKKDARISLRTLLTATRNPLLRPDADFLLASQVVSGQPDQPKNLFAFVLTDYLLQPDYDCRQPIFADYFKRRYGQTSRADRCQAPVPFILLDRLRGPQPLLLDPARVSDIHLLFGGPGPSLASTFGHVALRLVVCPEEGSTKEECDSNLQGHLVLGYMAHIDEFELNTWKGLSGSYKAYLFATPFLDVYRTPSASSGMCTLLP
jgi:hypothetical protein